jgi:hypothetical protein
MPGEWWVPGKPEDVAYGRLRFSPEDGLELDLASGTDIVGINSSVPWLNGLTVQGRPITLRNCFAREWSLTIPGGIAARIYAEQASAGNH